MWDTIVTITAIIGMILMLTNIVGTVAQLSEGKATVWQFWLRLIIFFIWLIVCGRVLYWW